MRIYRADHSELIIVEDDNCRDIVVIDPEKVEIFIETLRKVANGEEVEENI